MKPQPQFKVNLIEDANTAVYVVLPKIEDLTFEAIALSIEFLNKYSKLIFLSSEFDYSFYKLVFLYSKTFSKFKNIDIAINNVYKIRDIQTKSAIILYLSNEEYIVESDKKAIFCSISENSDLVFSDLSNDSRFSIPVYLRSFLNFIGIPEKRLINDIEIEYEDILSTSSIAKNHKGEDYHVIFQNSMISSYKITSFLKKHKLSEKLLIISPTRLKIADPKVEFYKNYDFLDLLALNIYAKNIATNHIFDFRNIFSQLRIGHIYTSSHQKDYFVLLKEISTLIMNV